MFKSRNKRRRDGTQVFVEAMQRPGSEQEARSWQQANRDWWEKNPMSYDWNEELSYEEFSSEFYEEIDRRFFEATRQFMPWANQPFDPLIDFQRLRTQDVLEIGVGSGSHAQLIAKVARSYTGIDITEQAIKRTARRMELQGIDATIRQMDAETMDLEDERFDMIWTWGVIHHSANTRRIVEEMHRVLRPGGEATVMVYHTNFWNKYVVSGLFHGVLRGKLLRTRSLSRIRKEVTDGSIARFFNGHQWHNLVEDLFSVQDIQIYGQTTDLIPLPAGGLKDLIVRSIPNRFARFLTNDCRMGSLLVSRLRKE